MSPPARTAAVQPESVLLFSLLLPAPRHLLVSGYALGEPQSLCVGGLKAFLAEKLGRKVALPVSELLHAFPGYRRRTAGALL